MHSKLQVVVGRNIRRFRLADGLTIEELAFRAQLHHNYLGDLERGRRNPSLSNLNKIADALKRTVSELLTAGGVASAPSPAREKDAVYVSVGRDKGLASLVKILRGNNEKDRKQIIELAKSLSAKLKKS